MVGVVRAAPSGVDTAPLRAVVTWAGPGEPIMLTLYGPDGAVTVPLLPKRALELANELLTRGVQAIKADPGGPMGARMSRAHRPAFRARAGGGRCLRPARVVRAVGWVQSGVEIARQHKAEACR